MAAPLVIDESALAALNGLREHAEANPFALDELKLMQAGRARPVGDRPGFAVTLPVGVRVVYSLEEHPRGQYRHLSVSAGGELPNPFHVQVLMDLLDFVTPLAGCALYLEAPVLNVLEPTAASLMPAGAVHPLPS